MSADKLHHFDYLCMHTHTHMYILLYSNEIKEYSYVIMSFVASYWLWLM